MKREILVRLLPETVDRLDELRGDRRTRSGLIQDFVDAVLKLVPAGTRVDDIAYVMGNINQVLGRKRKPGKLPYARRTK